MNKLSKKLLNISNTFYLNQRVVFLSQDSSSKKDGSGQMIGKNLLTLKSFSRSQIEDLLWTALDMKQICKQRDARLNKLLRGINISAIFQKKSTRTRLSFEGGAHKLGAHLIYCNKDDIHLGVNESIQDTARVLSRLCDGITARVNEHSMLENLAKNSTVPVINALSGKSGVSF
jgi:ornithine carbamoyltransferase